MTRPLRILYCAGPGNVIGTYRHWKDGYDDPSQVAITYSGQFYEVCRQVGAEAYVISYCEERDKLVDGPFRIEHRPLPVSTEGPGPLYRLGQLWSGLKFTLTALCYRPDVMLTMGGAEWFSLGLIPLLGVKVVVTFHGHLWRVARPPTGLDRFFWKLNGRFFRRHAKAFMYISDSIAEQLRGLTGPLSVPVLRFTPTYRAELFRPAASTPPPAPPPYKVFYAGRVEENKGVFALLDIAKRFKAEGRTDIEFDLCGDGHALDELRRQAKEAGLADTFRCHGHVIKREMASWYQRSHLVVVPTTTDSIEGLNKVVVEAVLASRPVVTSRVCPALEYVRPGVLEVPPDDTKAYGDAILRLVDDRALYEEKVRGCAASTEQFYDPARSWAATLRKVLALIGATGDVRQAAADESAAPAAVSRAAASAR
jgi:glycosyltransferase involved in cell wall biosynthesis